MNQKLAKVLARAGVASRRKAEELIAAGKVSIDGRAERNVATRVDAAAHVITVSGKKLHFAPQKSYIILHKPPNYVTTKNDPEGRPTVYDLLDHAHRFLFYVGRLDFASEGLVLMTDDGDLAQKLAHPKFQVVKIYQVKLQGTPDPNRFERMTKGLRSEGDLLRAQHLKVVKQNPANFWLEIQIAEGKKHAIRRLCEAVGYTVLRLKRTAFGPFRLSGLPPGKWRLAKAAELQEARKTTHKSS